MYEMPYAYISIVSFVGSVLSILFVLYRFKLERDKRKLYEKNVRELCSIISDNMIQIANLRHGLMLSDANYTELKETYFEHIDEQTKREKTLSEQLTKLAERINDMKK